MDIQLSAHHRDLRERLDELFSPELLGTLRRLGERPLGSADTPLEPAAAAARDSVWRVLRDLGIVRLAVPPGGGGDGWHAALVVVAEVMGHALFGSPLLETATAAQLIVAGGADPLGLLPRVADGSVSLTVANRAGDWGDPGTPPLRVAPDGRTVHGQRRFVAFAADVDYLLVVGAGPAGPALALVPRDQPGVAIRRQDDITRGDLYAVSLRAAAVPAGGWLGGAPDWPGAVDAYRQALASARLRQAAYLVGLARGALELTVDYTRARKQFGQPVARFQAPAFRLAALYARIEAVAALVGQAARQADQGHDHGDDALRALALASDLARDASTEAVQLHGARGMTEASDAQCFYRRAALDSIWLGTPTALRDRLAARLTGPSLPG